MTTIEDFLVLAGGHGRDPNTITRLVRKADVREVYQGTGEAAGICFVGTTDNTVHQTTTPLADIITQLTPTQAP